LTRKFSLLSEHEAISSTLEAGMLYWSCNAKNHKESSDFLQKKKKSLFMYKKENIWILNAWCVCVCKKNTNTTRKLKKKTTKLLTKNILLLFIDIKFLMETATE
jgi:hypothetical protein